MSLSFAIIALVGISGMTWLFPVAGALILRARRKGKAKPLRVPFGKIAILIPAHNEEGTLPKTLASIRDAIEVAKKDYPEVDVAIWIGADGCSDETAAVAQKFGAQTRIFPQTQGKWKTIIELLKASADADWIVLSDAGVLWSPQFLSSCIPYCENPDNLGVAPTYRNPSAGWLEAKIWQVECFLKALENAAGGPVSVHGLTVLFRREPMLETCLKLTTSQSQWINDDVAISLSLRLTYPNGNIIYLPQLASMDCPESHLDAETGAPIRELGRRKRMVLGNIQWISSILIPRWRENPVAALISCRRVFRLTWAYWFLALGLVLATALGPVASVLILSVLVFVAFKLLGWRPLQMLIDAGRVSLAVPYYLFSGQSLTRWK